MWKIRVAGESGRLAYLADSLIKYVKAKKKITKFCTRSDDPGAALTAGVVLPHRAYSHPDRLPGAHYKETMHGLFFLVRDF